MIPSVLSWKFNDQDGMECVQHPDGTWEIAKFPGGIPSQAEIDLWTAEYIARAHIPNVVTMHQARRALLNAGLLAQADAAIAAMTGVAGDAARIDWEFSPVVRRESQLVVSVAAQLGLTDADLDALFIAASNIN